MARRPSFIDERADVSECRKVIREIERARSFEEAIRNKMPSATVESTLHRINALDEMYGEAMLYMRFLYAQRQGVLAGYHVGDLVRIAATLESGQVMGVQPTEEPTHLVVVTAGGIHHTLTPDRIIPIVER